MMNAGRRMTGGKKGLVRNARIWLKIEAVAHFSSFLRGAGWDTCPTAIRHPCVMRVRSEGILLRWPAQHVCASGPGF